MNDIDCAFVVNPAARNGWVGKNWPDMARIISRYLPIKEVHFSQQPHHAQQLAEQLSHSSAPLIISVGGDGTHSDVANGILKSGVPAGSISLGIIDAGTGGDFRRVLRGEHNLAGYCQTIATQPANLVDVIQVQYCADEVEAKRFVLNMATCCLGANVIKHISHSRGRTPFKMRYALATLSEYFKFETPTLRLFVDGEEEQQFMPLMVAVANGSHAGGGMACAPQALLDDGLLNVTVIQPQSLFSALKVMKTLYTGDVSRLSTVHNFIATGLKISGPSIDFEVDGDLVGCLPARFTVLPKALSVIGIDPRRQAAQA